MTPESILAPVAQLTVPDQASLSERAKQALTFIESYVIDSPEAYQLAAEELAANKSRQRKLEEQRTAITGPLNQVLTAVNALFRGPRETLEAGEALLKRKMLAWDDLVRQRAEAARRAAEEAAAKQRAEAEAAAAAQAAEAQRLAAEAQQKAAAGDLQAAAVAQAAAQRAQDEAIVAADTAQMVVAPLPAVAMPAKVKGISTTTRLTFEVTDLLALVKHVAEHPELIGLLQADEVRLRAYVKGLGVACNLPGVRVDVGKSLSARAA